MELGAKYKPHNSAGVLVALAEDAVLEEFFETLGAVVVWQVPSLFADATEHAPSSIGASEASQNDDGCCKRNSRSTVHSELLVIFVMILHILCMYKFWNCLDVPRWM
jgi:hypothetical protein